MRRKIITPVTNNQSPFSPLLVEVTPVRALEKRSYLVMSYEGVMRVLAALFLEDSRA